MDIENLVIEVIAKDKGVSNDEISVDTSFKALGVSSMDAIAIAFQLEEEFSKLSDKKVAISDSEIMAIEVVGDLVNAIKEKI